MKRFGVGRPFSVSREPSVPPLISVRFGSRPTRRIASSARSTISGRFVELVAHVAVLDLLGVLDSRARLARGDIAEDLTQQRDVLLEERVVVVAQDDAQLDDRRVAGDLVDVDESLALVRRLRREAVARQPDDDLRGQLERVHEPVLAPAGMLGAPVDGHDEARRGERLVVQLAGGRAVERVRRLGPEALEVEVVGARAELLVGVEADAQRPVRKLGMRDQVRDRRHDLGDTRLVVGAEQRRAVARDQVVPDVIRQLR